MLRITDRALLAFPLALAAGCADPAIGPTVDTPPVVVPTEVRPLGAPESAAVTVPLVRCDDGGEEGGVVVDGVCI